jgi:hypothetical protein
MPFPLSTSRRRFIQSASLLTAGLVTSPSWLPKTFATQAPRLLEEFNYGDITLASELHNKQLEETHSVLMGLSDDSLLKPFRQMTGQPAAMASATGKPNPSYLLGNTKARARR